jgi:prepilin signal peptidase PulO-like enzyme (type II secretory pathway)
MAGLNANKALVRSVYSLLFGLIFYTVGLSNYSFITLKLYASKKTLILPAFALTNSFSPIIFWESTCEACKGCAGNLCRIASIVLDIAYHDKKFSVV